MSFLRTSIFLAFAIYSCAAQNSTCQQDISNAVFAVGQAALHIAKAVIDCPAGNTTLCIEDVSSTVQALAEAGTYISNAIPDCGGEGSKCATDITIVVNHVANATTYITEAVDDCAHPSSPKCKKDIDDAGAAIEKAAQEIIYTIEDCTGSLIPANCTSDVTDAVFSMTAAAENIKDATVDCVLGKTAECVQDISIAVENLGNASTYISKAIGDCGGAGSDCATDLSQVVVHLAKISDDVGKALTDCAGPQKLQCIADIGAAFGEVGAGVQVVLKAIHDCQLKKYLPFRKL